MPVNRKTSVEFVARLTGFNNVDITTKSAPTEEFETAVYTAYFLLFDSSTGARIAVDSVDVSSGSLSQTIVGKMPGPVTACFIANIPQGFAAKNLTSLTALNSAVLDITYATYSEAGGYLGVPKLTVNGETKLCIPMFGSREITNITNGGNIEIPVKRMFAKITVELKLSMNLSGFQSAIQNWTNYELSYYNLHDLPNKVRLVEDKKSESPWKDGSGNPATFQSANVDAKIYNSTSSMEQKSYTFDCYVPEFYLNPKQNPTNDQRYKPVNKADGTFPIYLELVGQYNAYSITSTDINYKVYLGNDNVSDFSLARNTHYKNVLTIKGTNQNSTTPDNLDHRVTTSTINNPVAKAGKAANCYVINATGEYNFPAYKGAYNDLTKAVLCNNQTANELVILANDNSSNIELKDYIYDPERNLISFNVSKIANGNVVLGLKNRDGSLEWSWHLWFNREYGNIDVAGWAKINDQTLPNGIVMMDRNLGAVSSSGAINEGLGLYYKYGNKNPYIDSYSSYVGGGTSGANTWNPSDDINTNDNNKSVHDPCPPGYKIPGNSDEIWSSSTSFNHTNLDISELFSTGVLRVYNNPDAIYFPYSAYQGASSVNSTEKKNIYIEEELAQTGVFYRFQKTTIKANITTSYGAIWTNTSGKARKYYYGTIKLKDIVSDFTFVSGEMKTYSWFNWTDYKYTESIDWTATQALKTLLAIGTEKESYGLEEADYSTTTGLQVRCVKE